MNGKTKKMVVNHSGEKGVYTELANCFINTLYIPCFHTNMKKFDSILNPFMLAVAQNGHRLLVNYVSGECIPALARFLEYEEYVKIFFNEYFLEAFSSIPPTKLWTRSWKPKKIWPKNPRRKSVVLGSQVLCLRMGARTAGHIPANILMRSTISVCLSAKSRKRTRIFFLYCILFT